MGKLLKGGILFTVAICFLLGITGCKNSIELPRSIHYLTGGEINTGMPANTLTLFELEPEPPQNAPAPAVTPAEPVAYVWGSPHVFSFRTEVRVANNGSEVAANVWVDLPLLENGSPYQTTTLTATNYEIAYATGRVAGFGIGDLQPGEIKTVIADYTVTVRPVLISSTNETVEKAMQAYSRYAGSGSGNGNCRTLASGFVERCRELGVTARLVNGFARAQKGNMTPGSLEGSRHSWAEFYVEGLGWVPVDLTFQYFGTFPHASHVIETYADESVRVYHRGGSLNVVWRNSIR